MNKQWQYRTLRRSDHWDLSQHPMPVAARPIKSETRMSPSQMPVLGSFKWVWRRERLAGSLALAFAICHLPSAAQTAGIASPTAQHYACRVFYLPARAVWMREMTVEHNDTAVYRIRIDGVPSHGFSHQGTVLSTHLDNERIQIDLNSGLWRSEFRDRAEGEGVCLRKSAP
jgi:hypothetical protein